MRVHFIGIGGIGMSALARYFKSEKWNVSGSDLAKSQIAKNLAAEGMSVKIGPHKAANVASDTNLIVMSQAVRKENPELMRARKLGIQALTYPEAIAGITSQYRTIAVAGAHGKSTTTALAALTLMKGGLDPTVIVGTNLKELGGKNFRRGKGSYLVLEADEFGNAFSHYFPTLAIITNIDREHLDVYKNLGNVKKAFLNFINNIQPGGILVANRDDKNLFSLQRNIVRIAKKNNIRIVWYSLRDSSTMHIKRILKIPGIHNLSNAKAVYEIGKILGIKERDILSALGSYKGAWRRMEYRGTFAGSPVYDDYAHHPTEIKATLQAFREKFPTSEIVCIFQPHQIKRLQALFKEFQEAFAFADKTILIPIYKVAGRDEKPSKFDSLSLAKAIQKRYPKKALFYIDQPKHLKTALMKLFRESPPSKKVIIMMGAGDIVQYTDSLL